LFDESTRIPLLISHPNSPFQGSRYPHPVEQIDIFPTILDGLSIFPRGSCIKQGPLNLCLPLEGKSLYPILMGRFPNNQQRYAGNGRKELYLTVTAIEKSPQMLLPTSRYAIQQRLICISADQLRRFESQLQAVGQHNISIPSPSLLAFPNAWYDCKRKGEVSLMGYSLRTSDHRYTAWLPFNFTRQKTSFLGPIFHESLFNHTNEALTDFTHLEVVDLVREGSSKTLLLSLRSLLFRVIAGSHRERV
jgi:hypothetical protein